MSETSTPDAGRRPLFLMGAGLAGVVVGLIVLYAVFSPTEPVAITPPPPPAAEQVAPQVDAPPPSPELEPALPEGRNPFSQLVVPAELTADEGSVEGGPLPTGAGVAPPANSDGPAQEEPPEAPSSPPNGEAVIVPDLAPDEPPPPLVVDDPVLPPTEDVAPVRILPPDDPPVLLSDSLWRMLLENFQWLRLIGVYEDDTGEVHALVDVDGRVYGVTVQQSAGPYMVDHIEGRCIEVSTLAGPATRALLRTCMPPSAGDDLAPGTTAANGRCVELRTDLTFIPPPPPALLERRVFLCRNIPDVPIES